MENNIIIDYLSLSSLIEAKIERDILYNVIMNHLGLNWSKDGLRLDESSTLELFESLYPNECEDKLEELMARNKEESEEE